MKQEEIDTRIAKIQNKLLDAARGYASRLEEPDVKDLIFLQVTNKLAELDPPLYEELTVVVNINPVTNYIQLAFHRVH